MVWGNSSILFVDLGTKKAAHIGGASCHHGPKLHKLVAVQIVEIQEVSFFVCVGAVRFVHRVFVLRL